MLQIIPVLDIQGGVAVHARGGQRDDYRPLRSVLRAGSDPILLAQAVRDVFGLDDLYLADLDAIAGALPALGLYERIAGLDLTIRVDAGLRDGADLVAIREKGVESVVIGLETVAGPDGLRSALEAAGAVHVAFSLDLRDGRPLVPTRATWGTDDPGAIVDRAVAEGVRTVIRLDLARVGTGRGVGEGEERCPPGPEWVIGGGVAGPGDLPPLARRGYSAVLVGSALHDGRIGAGYLAAWRGMSLS